MIKILLVVLPLLLFGCSEIAGTSDETSTRSARVLKPDLSPAAGAKVELFLSGDTTRLPLKVAYCDNKGECRFDVNHGYYNIWVENDSLTAFKDSVLFNPSPVDTSSMVLNKTGGISGFIRLQPGDNPVEVYIGVLGTYKYCNVDEQGAFVLTGLAQGEYTLRLVNTKNIDYTPTFYTVRCISDSILTLKDTISLVYSGIPAVYGITAQFDSVTGYTKVSWNRSSYMYLDRYIVYCRLSTAPSNQNETKGMTSDTTFIDTTTGSINGRIRYSIAILSQTGKSGNAYLYTDVDVAAPDSLLRSVSPIFGTSSKSGSAVNLVWRKIPDARLYQVHLASDRSFSDSVKVVSLPDTQVSVSSLASSCYFWRIRAMNSSNQYSPWSAPWMFGVGVFTYKIGWANEFTGEIKMAGNRYGQLIVNVPNIYGTANITLIDSLGKAGWQKQITAADKDFSVRNVQSTDDYFLVELGIGGSDSLLVIKYSVTGTELWRKMLNAIKSIQIIKQNNNIIAGTKKGSIIELNANGELLKETIIDDSLHYAIQRNDTSIIYVKIMNYHSIVLKEYQTAAKKSSTLDSAYIGSVNDNFFAWILNDGSVNLLYSYQMQFTVDHISPDGKVKNITGGINNLSFSQNNDRITTCFYNRDTRETIVYDENMIIKTKFKHVESSKLKDPYIFAAWDIRENWDVNILLRVYTENFQSQAYLLRFPIDGKYMLPSEVIDE